jgi:hypothetical protein
MVILNKFEAIKKILNFIERFHFFNRYKEG